ncbi:aldo/keto reductase [Demetria terragena]|uniref:aldo/keto reductase n=1 Tax=Demetria terragena TaxID=63959 RepID=UPI00035D13F9|nr:aldo/keto reductase [Demetria terragena]
MDLTPDRLTLGVACLGNLFEEMSDRQAQALLESAWDAGIRSFDTAPHYGLGLSERRLGDFLGSMPAGAARVSTKVGRLLVDNPDGAKQWDGDLFRVRATRLRQWDFTADGIRRSLADSLRRLRIDRVETLYLHDPEQSPDPEAAVSEGMAALSELRSDGMTQHVGVGSMDVAMLAEAAQNCDVTELMVAGRHTLVDDSASKSVLPMARKRGVRVAATAVFNSGLLAQPEPGDLFDYGQASAALVALARRIADVCRAHGTDLPTAALHYPTRDNAVTSVVVGMRTPDQVRQNIERVQSPPDSALWRALAAEGLLQAAV